MIMSMQGRVMTDDRGISVRSSHTVQLRTHIMSGHMYVYTHGHKSNITKIVCKNIIL